MAKLILIAVALATLSGCASYNKHIDKCDGKIGTFHRVLTYTPIGILVDNGICLGTGRDRD